MGAGLFRGSPRGFLVWMTLDGDSAKSWRAKSATRGELYNYHSMPSISRLH